MILTIDTFNKMHTSLRLSYGPNWRPDLDDKNEARAAFFCDCRALIPDEMADEMIAVYRSRRDMGPYSGHAIFSAYLEKRLEDAKSSEFVIEKLVSAIREYEYSGEELTFESRDEYLFENVIPMFPCPDGVREFYLRNKKKLECLALHSPDEYEESKIYDDLGKDYDKQLVIIERRSIIELITHTALPAGNNNKRLED